MYFFLCYLVRVQFKLHPMHLWGIINKFTALLLCVNRIYPLVWFGQIIIIIIELLTGLRRI